jgi:phage anti-repressor protein
MTDLNNSTVTSITNNNSSSNELLAFIKHSFTSDEQQLFVDNFHIYLNFPDEAFIVDLDKVYEWLGYSKKFTATRKLIDCFEENIDYIVQNTVHSHTNGGSGLNKCTYLMTVDAFKEFCSTAGTDRGKQIRKYYIKLEKCLNHFLKYQLQIKDDQLQIKDEQLQIKDEQLQIKDEQLQIKDEQLQQLNSSDNKTVKDPLPPYEPLLREQSIYLGKQLSDLLRDLFKLGETADWDKRKKPYATGSSMGFEKVFEYKTNNSKVLETALKHCLHKFKFGNPKPTKGGNEWYNSSLEHLKIIILSIGTCLDTIASFNSTVSRDDVLKHILYNLILALYDNSDDIKTIIPDIIKHTSNDAFDYISKRQRARKHLSPHLDIPTISPTHPFRPLHQLFTDLGLEY